MIQLPVVAMRLVQVMVASQLALVAWASCESISKQSSARGYENKSTMIKELRPRAATGEPEAQLTLGTLYLQMRQGCADCMKEARFWLESAAKQNNRTAQFFLGDIYFDGTGVTQDFQEAAHWWQQAAEAGYTSAQYALGFLYAQGKGVTQNSITAHMWFNLAAAAGNNDAGKARDTIARQMSPNNITEAQRLAREWKPTEK